MSELNSIFRNAKDRLLKDSIGQLKGSAEAGIKDVKAQGSRNLGALFKNAKAKLYEAAASTPAAQEVRNAEIKRLLPWIGAGVLALLIFGYFVGRRGSA